MLNFYLHLTHLHPMNTLMVNDFVKRMEHYALAELKSQNIMFAAMQMTRNSIKGICESRQDEFNIDAKSANDNKVHLANACLLSIEKMNCNALMNSDEINTPACNTFRKAADKYDK